MSLISHDDSIMNRSAGAQRGLGAITVIILIVLFSLIGAYMSTLSTMSTMNTILSGGAIQTWFASRSGVEWALHQALNRPTCVCGGTTCCSAAPAINGANINFTGGGTAGYQASIDCSEISLTEGSDNYCVYNIGVTATRGNVGDETYVARRIEVTVTDRNAP